MGGVSYVKVDDAGLHVKEGGGRERVMEVDTVVVCAGQVSESSLEPALKAGGAEVFLIGGAHLAAELDAKRAIDQVGVAVGEGRGGRQGGQEGINSGE